MITFTLKEGEGAEHVLASMGKITRAYAAAADDWTRLLVRLGWGRFTTPGAGPEWLPFGEGADAKELARAILASASDQDVSMYAVVAYPFSGGGAAMSLDFCTKRNGVARLAVAPRDDGMLGVCMDYAGAGDEEGEVREEAKVAAFLALEAGHAWAILLLAQAALALVVTTASREDFRRAGRGT